MASGVTIVIPTYNRAGYLKQSLQSALDQRDEEVRVVVLDNASTDTSRDVVAAIAGTPVRYERFPVNAGLLGNFLRVRQFCSTEYVCILQDDDYLAPGFAASATAALREHPSAAFAYSRVTLIDSCGAVIEADDARCTDAAGLVTGRDYLERIVDGENWVIHLSSTMFRTAALDRCGWFDAPHGVSSLDFNAYFRLAARFDLYALTDALTRVRHHPQQDHRSHAPAMGAMAMLAERIDAASFLFEATPEDSQYREWLARRVRDLNRRRSTLVADAVSGIDEAWEERLRVVRLELDALISHSARTAIVADDSQLDSLSNRLRALPFTERDGEYWGPPGSDAHAIEELERLRALGAEYLVVAWPALWLLDFFKGFRAHLSATYPCLADNSRLAVFDLRTPLPNAAVDRRAPPTRCSATR